MKALELSPNFMSGTNIGIWAYEFDNNQKPRLFIDEKTEKLLGLPEDTTPEEMFEIWNDNVDKAHKEEIRECLTDMCDGMFSEVQYLWHRPDGGIWNLRCSGIRDFSYKKGIRIEGILIDMSSLLHFERNGLEELLASLSGEFLDVYFLDPVTGKFEAYSNKSSFDGDDNRDLTNVDFYEDVAEKSGGIVHPDDKPLIDEKYSRENLIGILESGIPQEFIVRWPIDGNDKCLYMKNKLTRFIDNNGIQKIVIGVEDVTKQKEAEKNLEEAMEAAQSASKSKSTFLFNMSHDIRTPMNAIMGYTDRVLNHIDKKEIIVDSINKIKSASDYLLQLINDVLDMARIESDKFELETYLFDYSERANQICEIFSSDLSQKNITLEKDFSNITDKYAWYDGLRVRQIITNILSNAVKYTLHGGTIKYTIKQIPADDEYHIRTQSIISDNGIGMSEEFLKHIYEQFTRSESSTVSKIQGSGLGMSIVKRFVDMMGGTIDIQSKQDVGTTVTVTLDFIKATPEDIKNMNVKTLDDRSFDNLEGLKILLVEDNEMNREVGVEILEDIGCIVDTASDGVEAVSKVRNSAPGDYDVILMDIQMPLMNGYEATKSIRALPDSKLSSIKIIALTANAFEEDRKDALAMGMDAHLPKPINVTKLLETISEMQRNK